jgi:hypothetical protein
MRLDQDLNRFNYILDKCGLNRATLNLTSHGLRHEYANDRVEVLTGEESPVRSGAAPKDPERFQQMREIVTEELGHSRTSITAAYHGSPSKPPQRSEDKRVSASELQNDEPVDMSTKD